MFCDPAEHDPFGAHRKESRICRNSGIPYTNFLRASFFMQNLNTVPAELAAAWIFLPASM